MTIHDVTDRLHRRHMAYVDGDRGSVSGSQIACHIAIVCSHGSLHVLCTVASDGIRPSCTSGTFGVMCTLRNTWRLPKERSIAVRHEV
jgi:hypothetical protein